MRNVYDRDAAKQNRTMGTYGVLARLQADMPDVWARATVVGRWVWVAFDTPPAQAVRVGLLELGFHWNHTRQCWQHSCGVFRHYSKKDPRYTYGVVDATEVNLDAATVGGA